VLLVWRASWATTSWRRPWAGALALTLLYAITDEIHQGGVAGRFASAFDVAIDAAGAVIAVVAAAFLLDRRARRRADATSD
jgi:VanZ family protein